MRAKSRLFEKPRNEPMPLHIIHILLFQRAFSPPQLQPKLGVIRVPQVPLIIAILLRHEAAFGVPKYTYNTHTE